MEHNKNPGNRHTNIVSWFFTMGQSQFSGERIVFLANDAGTTGCSHADSSQKLTKNGLWT